MFLELSTVMSLFSYKQTCKFCYVVKLTNDIILTFFQVSKHNFLMGPASINEDLQLD